MRREFADQLYNKMKDNPNIWCLTGDLGIKILDDIRQDFPNRFINCGASEQAMLDISVGLAYEGKKVFVYTITPFFYRAFETIRTYINYEKLSIILCGSGRDKSYIHDGYSHDASDVLDYFRPMKNFRLYLPNKKEEILEILDRT